MSPQQSSFEPAWPTGQIIMLAGSIPLAEDANESRARLDILAEEAIISLARSAFSRSSHLVYTGTADVALLLAGISAEYTERKFAEGPGATFREDNESSRHILSAFISSGEADESGLLDALTLWQFSGFVDMKLDVISTRDPARAISARVIEESQPAALVCIGGYGRTMFQTASLFREMRGKAPIYALASTGGDTLELAREMHESVITFEDRFYMEFFPDQDDRGDQQDRNLSVQGIPPYPIIMQQLVDEIYQSGDSDN